MPYNGAGCELVVYLFNLLSIHHNCELACHLLLDLVGDSVHIVYIHVVCYPGTVNML